MDAEIRERAARGSGRSRSRNGNWTTGVRSPHDCRDGDCEGSAHNDHCADCPSPPLPRPRFADQELELVLAQFGWREDAQGRTVASTPPPQLCGASVQVSVFRWACRGASTRMAKRTE